MNNFLKSIIPALNDKNLVLVALGVVISGFLIYEAGYAIGKFIYYFINK